MCAVGWGKHYGRQPSQRATYHKLQHGAYELDIMIFHELHKCHIRICALVDLDYVLTEDGWVESSQTDVVLSRAW